MKILKWFRHSNYCCAGILVYLDSIISLAFIKYTSIDVFVQSMYHLNAISKDTYDTMKKLENTTSHDQEHIFLRLLMDDNRNPERYRNFKQGLKKIDSYKTLYYQIEFIG